MPLPMAARAEIGRLRRHIARIENRLSEEERIDLDWTDAAFGLPDGKPPERWRGRAHARAGAQARRLPLGLAGLDGALGGGLLLGALHEIRADRARDGAAASGFALAVLARLAMAGTDGTLPVLWVAAGEAAREAGGLYGPGLAALGIDPGRLVRVAVRRPAEALWVFETALACRGLAAAVCELYGAAPDLTQSRRCSLRARDNGVTGLVLGLGVPASPSAAETRFCLASVPAGTLGGFDPGVGRPAWRLSLEKNRGGRTGAFSVEWNGHARRFEERGGGLAAAADPEPVAAAALHRPADPAGGGGAEGRRHAS